MTGVRFFEKCTNSMHVPSKTPTTENKKIKEKNVSARERGRNLTWMANVSCFTRVNVFRLFVRCVQCAPNHRRHFLLRKRFLLYSHSRLRYLTRSLHPSSLNERQTIFDVIVVRIDAKSLFSPPLLERMRKNGRKKNRSMYRIRDEFVTLPGWKINWVKSIEIELATNLDVLDVFVCVRDTLSLHLIAVHLSTLLIRLVDWMRQLVPHRIGKRFKIEFRSHTHTKLLVTQMK